MEQEQEVLIASKCANCGCHDCTTRRRIVGGEPTMLCDDCRKQIKPVRRASHRETEGRGEA